MKVLRQLYRLLNRRERWQLVVLSGALILRAVVEMVGVASVPLFMSVVANPVTVQQHAWLQRSYEIVDAESVHGFLTVMGIAIVIVLAISNAFSAFALWAMLRFSWDTHHRLSIRLLETYLSQPYSFFVRRNSSSLNKALLSEVQVVVGSVLIPVLNIAARALVIAALVGLLVASDPSMAMVIVTILGGTYAALYLIVRQKQHRLGVERRTAQQHRFKIAAEAFGAIKEVKVLQRESSFVRSFTPHSISFSRAMASNGAISQLPRYLFETIAFGGIVLIVLYQLSAGYGSATILPLLSLYAFAGYRLLPELQQLFASITNIRFAGATLDELADDIRRYSPTAPARTPDGSRLAGPISLEGVTFTYPGAEKPALRSVSMRIGQNETIGLVGPSGCGKTTLVDLILGLYECDGGRIQVAGVTLDTQTLSSWRAELGYVPQHIFLADDSIANNVALGLGERVDPQRLERALRIAHLQEFVTTLPDGANTVVGERGVRLSGGQRQRIGIARALYHDPSVLIMDEATSALDGATEEAVMEAIRELGGQKTIVIVAHRLSTVRDCDTIFMLADGQVVDCGTYDELAVRNLSFRGMARS